MLAKINRGLRYFVLSIGGLLLIVKLMEKKKTDRRSSKEGFQTEEFDDIW